MLIKSTNSAHYFDIFMQEYYEAVGKALDSVGKRSLYSHFPLNLNTSKT